MLNHLRVTLERYIPNTARETWDRYVGAIMTTLLATGLLTQDSAALWTRLGLATVTLLFAWLYATSTVRSALYGLAVVIGGVFGAYGIAKGVDWALIVSTFGQALGVLTAAAKAVPPAATDPVPTAG